MLILADVGNSKVKWALVRRETIEAMVSLPLPETPGVVPTAWTLQIQLWQISPPAPWVIASTNPQVSDVLHHWLASLGFSPIHLKDYRDVPLTLDVDFPERVGIDRLLNGLAAVHHGPSDQPKLIVDAGSAVTIDWVDAKNKFCGGAILPGFRLMSESLHRYTARLPLVQPSEHLPPLPAKNTEAAIRAGMLAAILGAISWLKTRYLEAHSRNHLGAATAPSTVSEYTEGPMSKSNTEPVCYLTGGDAHILHPHLDRFIYWPEMTLQGLYHAARRHLCGTDC